MAFLWERSSSTGSAVFAWQRKRDFGRDESGVVVGIAVGSVVVVALSGGMILWWRRGNGWLEKGAAWRRIPPGDMMKTYVNPFVDCSFFS